MRASGTITLVAALAFTGVRLLSGTGGGGGAAEVPQAKTAKVRLSGDRERTLNHPATEYAGGCTAFESKETLKSGAADEDAGAAKSVVERFFSGRDGLKQSQLPDTVHYAIALAPDPVHTNLSLLFDREMATVQQAAQDEGFTYDSSWLPWRAERQVFSGLADQQAEASVTEARESCPGVLLFRRSVSDAKRGGAGEGPTRNSYENGLVVLIVGEQPTGGINATQWANAAHWLATHAASGSSVTRELRVLGPTFSGSLVSLRRELAAIYSPANGPDVAGPAASARADSAALRGRFPAALVLSGSVRSCASIRWFQGQMASLPQVRFGSFQENDAVQMNRFLHYMQDQGIEGKDTAVLAEDETAYANSYVAPVPTADGNQSPTPACEFPYGAESRPLRISYPRDISALRSAYDKQSIFGGTGDRSVHPILQSSDDAVADGSNDSSDTIPMFSGQLTPIAQEAVLYGIVSYLRAHHTRYLLLRCTNQLDFLFLTRFFHRAYPEGRIVTVGADILFRREIDSTEFRGVLALSTYPLLPRDQHWSALFAPGQPKGAVLHTHRVFEDQSQQGAYLAARYLLDAGVNPVGANGQGIVLPMKANLPEVSEPYWTAKGGVPKQWMSAPTWLSVVGRDGYWPIAVLNEQSVPGGRLTDNAGLDPAPPPSSVVTLQVQPGTQYDRDPDHADQFSRGILVGPSLSWKMLVGLAMFLLVYQCIALAFGSSHASTRLLAGFREVPSRSQAFLLGLNSALAVMLLVVPLSLLYCKNGFNYLASDTPAVWGGRPFVVGAIIAVLAILLWRVRSQGRDPARRALQRYSLRSLLWFVVSLGVLLAIPIRTLQLSTNEANGVPLAMRIAHPTSGVSPLVPAMLLFGGFYLWSWQAMAGNMLLCWGRPVLPQLRRRELGLGWKNFYLKLRGRAVAVLDPGLCRLEVAQYRISQEMGRRILHMAAPFSFPTPVILPAVLLLVAAFVCFRKDLPLLTIEGHAFTLGINLALLLSLLVSTAEAARLSATWRELHRLLNGLNRMRLRRTFSRLRAIDTHSLWSVSGNARRVQSLFFAQELDAADRLLRTPAGRSCLTLHVAVTSGRWFVGRNAGTLDTGSRWEEAFRPVGSASATTIRELFADAVAATLNEILLPAWKEEHESLSIGGGKAGKDDGDSGESGMELSSDEAVRAAEEFVCFHYIAFIQNILARMRTMTLSMAVLFVGACFAISFYPFVPRTEIGMWMIGNLGIIGVSVVVVYLSMERDAILSYIANTTPGRLSSAFWLKTAGFLVGPVIGVLTTQFPAIADSVLAWVQPGLDAISK